jgi:hypothetical protein
MEWVYITLAEKRRDLRATVRICRGSMGGELSKALAGSQDTDMFKPAKPLVTGNECL